MAKSYLAKPGEVAQRWHLVDADGQVLGRLAAKLAVLLMGKHRPTYTPHVDTGEFVVVVNADKVTITGNKEANRTVYWHTGFMGHLREMPLGKFKEQNPEEVVYRAVRRMLPKSKLGRQMLSKLKVYRGAVHPHAAQKPEPLQLNDRSVYAATAR
ncbi:MAG: 50S ribosomal protein L13 [Planctomycetota bacterium]